MTKRCEECERKKAEFHCEYCGRLLCVKCYNLRENICYHCLQIIEEEKQ